MTSKNGFKEIFEASGLTMKEISEKSGVSLKTLHAYAKGGVAQPKREYVEKLAKALNVKASTLAGYED